MRLIHTLGTINPHGINERFTFNQPVVPKAFLRPFCLFNIFFSHISILLFPFAFYISISLRYLALYHYITTSLFISHIFTPPKDYSPKSHFSKSFFSSVYNLILFII